MASYQNQNPVPLQVVVPLRCREGFENFGAYKPEYVLFCFCHYLACKPHGCEKLRESGADLPDQFFKLPLPTIPNGLHPLQLLFLFSLLNEK